MLRKHTVHTLILLVSWIILSASVWAAPKVGIVDFEDRAVHQINWHPHFGEFVADMFTVEMVRSTSLEIYERRQIKSILNEQGFDPSARISPGIAAQIGRLTGLEFMITGAITQFGMREDGGGVGVHIGKRGYHASLEVKVIDVRTGRVVFTHTGSGTKNTTHIRVFGLGGGERGIKKSESDVLLTAVRDIVEKIRDADLSTLADNSQHSSPTAVLIAGIAGNTVTLNQGHAAGLQSGQTLAVQRRSNEVKDPTTGEIIKIQYTPVGTLQVLAVEASYANGELISGEAKIGDEIAAPQ